MAAPSRIGFVGTGKMGVPMIARLIGAGIQVQAYDVNAEALAACQAATGCDTVDSLAAAASGVDTVITMLPTGAIVRKAVLGDGSDGIASGLSAGSFIIDMSSSAPWETEQLAHDLDAMGITLVDAPVSGGVKRAIDGSLAVFIGGTDASFARVTPILEPIGKHLFHAGGTAAGHTTKALNNILSATTVAISTEVVRVAEASGLNPETFVDIVNASTGVSNATLNKMKQFVINESYASGFTLGLMQKDVGIARELADRSKLDVPVAFHVADMWRHALEELGGDVDHTAYDKIVKPRD